jgi:hypothetical protein
MTLSPGGQGSGSASTSHRPVAQTSGRPVALNPAREPSLDYVNRTTVMRNEEVRENARGSACTSIRA